MLKVKNKFKKGAASFYIVAFSTLILMIVAASFAAVIISEVERTSNNDLSQSAYDSALAGVEDAKLAYYNYLNCKAQGIEAQAPDNNGTLDCKEIIWYVETETEETNCDMISEILGRTGGESKAAQIIETNTPDVDNNMQQFYTCATMNDTLDDYTATLGSNMIKVVEPKFDPDAGVHASNINSIRISWFSKKDAENLGYTDYTNFSKTAGVTFPSLTASATGGLAPKASAPPTISLALVQAAEGFSVDDFDTTEGSRTNRGMLYLVPTNDESAEEGTHASYIKAENNYIDAEDGFLKSNDKTKENLPFLVTCNDDNEYYCSATIILPKPIGGERADDAFMLVMGLPYGRPDTTISLEFFTDNGESSISNPDAPESRVQLKGVQLEVDSTGKANDMYRRVTARLEESDSSLSIMGPLELFNSGGNGGGSGSEATNGVALNKNYAVTCEYDFNPTCSR